MDIPQSVHDELDKLICPIHHQRGSIAMGKDHFIVNCCCPEFEYQFREAFINVFSKELAKAMFPNLHKNQSL